eukprot:9255024-Alexandrium_andersonii.AAC.1
MAEHSMHQDRAQGSKPGTLTHHHGRSPSDEGPDKTHAKNSPSGRRGRGVPHPAGPPLSLFPLLIDHTKGTWGRE